MIKKESKNTLRLKRHLRVRKNISGTASVPRLNVYRSNLNISAQIIDDVTGNTLASASTNSMKIKSNNIDAAKKVGEEIALRAIKMNITEVVFDRGGYLYHGRVKALADAAREKGLKF